MKKNFFWIILIVVFSFPALFALFSSGFFQSDDGEWMIIRFSAFHQALKDGQFPVRFLDRLNYGYGYPVANFLYPGFMYFGEMIKVLGFGFVDTVKISFGLYLIGSVVFAFLWLSSIFGRWASFVGALIYLYAPYHIFDLYSRGSVGEIMALCFVPFIFWQIERKSFFWISIGTAMLILSHNTLALLFLPLIVMYLFFKGLPWFLYFLPSLILGLGISSFFWIPAIFDLKYTIFQQTTVSQWQNYFVSLDLIGVVVGSVLIFSLLVMYWSKSGIFYLMFFVTLICLFLSSSISSFVWEMLPVSVVQFPFRFLSVIILTTSFLLACCLTKIERKKSIMLGVLFLIAAFFSSFSFLTPSAFFDKGEGYYSTNEATTTVKDEYLPIWVKNKIISRSEKKIDFANGVVSNLQIRSNNIKFNASSSKNSTVTINTIFFPGWEVYVDNSPVEIDYLDGDGLIKFDLPAGIHNIEARFSETLLRLASDVMSVLSLSIVSVFALFQYMRKFV